MTEKTYTLLQDVERVTRSALESGALQSIDTRYEQITENGIPFLLRTLDNLTRKNEASQRLKKAGDTHHNPFKPYDEALYVADLGEHHVCLLNKFNVVDKHLLVVTRELESQQDKINRKDFNALARVMQDIDALAFYNGGKIAGASQPHKHLQLIPMPMEPFSELPFSEALNQLKPGHPNRSPDLKFRHAGMQLPAGTFDNVDRASEVLLTLYNQLREELAITDDGIQTTAPYNLLITRKWMLMVPRSEESFEGISFNSLAFVGALLVRSDEDGEKLKANGLMNTLVGVC
ncbi:DUF4922 domain-containing protein [Pontibacterium granulatum]|uniref:ATP adenylyltransferase family protein n=1 Tax=Pontibacterium granulatum TaxID=2036029 RepID=UPI00249B0A18|nr:DUF4922 domain-containing protein [Pontibacterium granulatum]MDI3323407.1 DUF4922 domain-containing protein [Pontibacterium granulatum]